MPAGRYAQFIYRKCWFRRRIHKLHSADARRRKVLFNLGFCPCLRGIPCGLRVFSREIPRRDDPRTGHVWLHDNGLGRNYWGDPTETQTAALPLQGEDALQGCYFFTALTLAHLALVAALMRARPAAEMWRFQLKQLSDLSLWYGVLVVQLEYWQD